MTEMTQKHKRQMQFTDTRGTGQRAGQQQAGPKLGEEAEDGEPRVSSGPNLGEEAEERGPESPAAAGRLSCSEACGVLAPQPESERTCPALQGRLLATGLPGKSQLLEFKTADLSSDPF